MQLSERLKPALPHLVAILIFMVLSFLYFYPVLEGKVLKANDSTVSRINSKEIQDYRDKYGKEPLWTNSIFGGMPAYLISTRYPGNLIKKADNLLRSFPMPVSVLFLSMTGFYILLLIFGASPWLSMAGAAAFSFSSFFFQILAAGHNTQAIALAYMAPLIGAIYYTYRKDMIKGALFTALILALEIVANHPQITYYSFLILLIFGITELIRSVRENTLADFIKRSVLLIVPFIIALGINFASLYTTWEYGKHSIRGKSELVTPGVKQAKGLDKDYITHWSYGVDETFNLLVPNYKGGSSKPFDRNSETYKAMVRNNAGEQAGQLQKYWGTQPGTDGPHYMGAIVIFLFVLGLLVVKGTEKWWLLAATILSVTLAWGKNFMFLSDIFIDFFPGYNKFRAVTMILVIAQLCIPLLGFIALRDIFEGKIKGSDLKKSLYYAAGISGGFLLLLIIIPGIAGSFLSVYEKGYPDWLKTALVADRQDLLRSDALRSLFFIALAAAGLFGFLSGKIKKEWTIALIGILILADLWLVDRRYLNADRFEHEASFRKSFSPSAADNFILADKGESRVLNLTVSIFNDNSPTSYFHHSIGGYHGAKMERYQELIDSVIFRELALIQTVSDKAQSLDDFAAAFKTTPALNMLNTEYVIYNPDAAPLVNSNSLGNAWFVAKAVLSENANAELAALKSINPSEEAVVDRKFSSLIASKEYSMSEGDKIELVSYLPNELTYKYSAEKEQMAVFSEIYYPAGWQATIDGKAAEHFRANYVLRAMTLPAGSHEVKFVFKPKSYITGNRVSMASSLILILLFAAYFGKGFISKQKNGN